MEAWGHEFESPESIQNYGTEVCTTVPAALRRQRRVDDSRPLALSG